MSTWIRLVAETCRLRRVRAIEEQLALAGYGRVAGVDEAGRGALAGPVVAAAVIPDPSRPIPGVDDSKALSPEKREALAPWIERSALAWAVVAIDAATIDSIDILQATRLAMRRALAALAVRPDAVITDAMPFDDLGVPCLAVIHGDALCHAVGCASILAKVGRDRMLRDLDRAHPGYGLAEHKGYGAASHLAALEALGPSPSHRLTFGRVLPRLREAA